MELESDVSVRSEETSRNKFSRCQEFDPSQIIILDIIIITFGIYKLFRRKKGNGVTP